MVKLVTKPKVQKAVCTTVVKISANLTVTYNLCWFFWFELFVFWFIFCFCPLSLSMLLKGKS